MGGALTPSKTYGLAYSAVGRAIFFKTSRNHTITQDGIYRIDVVGPGGGGPNAGYATGSVSVLAAGGGGGGYALKETFLKAGTLLAISIGAGGAGGGGTTGGNVSSPASDGGITTVIGSNVNMGATGGLRGNANYSVTSVLGGMGGYGYGGDVNYSGGKAGDISCTAATGANSCIISTGGASAGNPSLGRGIDSVSFLNQSTVAIMNGGAGIGEAFIGSPGGRGACEFWDYNLISPWQTSTNVSGTLIPSPSLPLLNLWAGRQQAGGTTQYYGNGGSQNSNGTYASATAGWLGGGGSCTLQGLSSGDPRPGGSPYGGGAGGMALGASTTATQAGAAGGSGLVIIERIA